MRVFSRLATSSSLSASQSFISFGHPARSLSSDRQGLAGQEAWRGEGWGRVRGSSVEEASLQGAHQVPPTLGDTDTTF